MPSGPARTAGFAGAHGGGEREPVVPTTVAAAATTRPMPGQGAAASNAARAGPRMKKTSRLIAS